MNLYHTLVLVAVLTNCREDILVMNIFFNEKYTFLVTIVISNRAGGWGRGWGAGGEVGGEGGGEVRRS